MHDTSNVTLDVVESEDDESKTPTISGHFRMTMARMAITKDMEENPTHVSTEEKKKRKEKAMQSTVPDAAADDLAEVRPAGDARGRLSGLPEDVNNVHDAAEDLREEEHLEKEEDRGNGRFLRAVEDEAQGAGDAQALEATKKVRSRVEVILF